MPNGFTIDETESANEVVLVGFDGDIDSNEFSLELGARLLHTERLAVARESSDECRVEETRLDNLANIAKITKLDEGIIFSRN